MATAPKIDRSRISVVADVHVDTDVKVGKQVIVGRGVVEEGGPNGQKRNVEGPDVFEGQLEGKNVLSTHLGIVSEGTPVEGDDNLGNGTFDFFPNSGWQDKKEPVVGEKGDNEDIDKKDAGGKG